MIHRFGTFELDLAKAELRADGEPLPLEPQVFALLAYLVENRERLVSRDEIHEKLWDGRIVTDAAVASRIKSARKALGDDGKSQRYIRTVHGQGFRFVAEVRTARPEPHAVAVEDMEPAGAELPATASGAHSRPSIAVLPFRPVGDAGPYSAIADALPHELITELSRLRWLFVTARGSSFRLRAADPDLREVGRVLGVHYGLSGTVEVTGRHLTVTTELVDTRSAEVIWAERYSGCVEEVHAVRTEIRSRILTALEIQIPLHEAALARLTVTGNLDAWSAYHLGLQHMYRFNRGDNSAAAALFRHAVALDPGFARAHAGLSFTHFQTAFMHQSDDIAGETALARRCAERGLELDPLDPFVNFTMGRSFWLEGELERGLVWLERATSLSPNYAQGIYARAWTETLAGHPLQGRDHVDLAMRLSPLDPLYYGMLGTRAFTHMARAEDAEAAGWAERAARSPGAHVLIAVIAAVAHDLSGDEVRAKAWAKNAHERNPALTGEDFFRAFPMKPDAMRSRVSSALARLGFPRPG
ncbi:MAG: winged helix-turn-helix domain-containing protein [Steroidobacteraceae bacterium]|jgi:TolB-like protein|nr:winged helix-turn-helix domain-containing protein [Steroidobacteraceae bacterium]